jgi:fructose-1,6-bisphosphatase/inositol monophosphatase family enzyme
MLLIRQAGGIITDLAGEPIPPIDPEQYKGQQYPLLAANKKIHAELLGSFKK